MSRLCDCSTRMASFATQPLAVIDAAVRLGDLRPSRVQHGDRKVLSDLAVRNLALLGQDGGPELPFVIRRSGYGLAAFFSSRQNGTSSVSQASGWLFVARQ